MSSGNGGPFDYLWTPGNETTTSIVSQFAGVYNLHVEDAKNCPKDTTITITEPNVLNASITSITHLLCNGDCTPGEAIVTPSGGTLPYTYQWLDAGNVPIPGYTDSTASTLCAGTYSVSVSDANLCNITLNNIIITEPALLTAVTSSLPTECNGAANGTVVVTPSGGTLPYSYTWLTNPGGLLVGTDSLLNNLPAGTYDYTVLDGNNCSITGSEIISEPDTIGFDFTKIDLLCNGDINGQAVIFNVIGGDGNYSYEWLDAANTIIGIGLSVNNLAAGDYSITVTDGNNCSTTLDFEIIEPLTISLITSSDSASCNGFMDGAVHVIASGGTIAIDYQYDWRDAGNVQVGTTADVFGLVAGTYTITVTDDNNCSKTQIVVIEEPDVIIIVPTISSIQCNGDMNGAISIVVSGGTLNYGFSWVGPNAFSSTNQNISGLEGGDYTITLTDANGCVDVQTYTVLEPAPFVFIPTIVHVECFATSTGSIQVNVNGGNGGYIYDWRDISNIQISTTDAIVGVPAGDYTLTVTDVLGCTYAETFTINESSDITFNGVLTPITCFNANDGAIDIFPQGGTPIYTFAWIGPLGFNSINQNISSLIPGTYTLTITDQNSCSKDTSFTLLNPSQITIAETISDIVCNGDMNGAIDVIINGGVPNYTTSWVGPNSFVSNSQNISGLEGGDYTLTVTDLNNCVIVQTYTVDEPLPFVFTPTINHVLCFGELTGSIQVAVSGGNGGYLYDWRDATNIQISTTNAIVNVAAGDYTLTVTDALNCSYFETFTVLESDEIFFNASISIISCFDSNDGAISLVPSGGTPNYSYSWVGPLGFNSINQNISNLIPGDYTCTIIDQNFCTKDTTISLINPGVILIDETLTHLTCNGDLSGAIDIVISGGNPAFTFDWTGPNAFVSNSQNISGLEAGDYTLIVTDSGSCSVTEIYTLIQPAPITFIETITTVLCTGDSTGAIEVIVSGGNGGFLYDWRDNANNQISITNEILDVPAGDYTLTVTDMFGCNLSQLYTIDEPLQAINLTLSSIDIDCFGDSDGSVGVAISGGTVITPADYMVEWYDDLNNLIGNTQIISNLPVGIYTVIVSDLNNCVASDSIEVFQSSDIVLNPIVSDALCNGDLNGFAQVFPSGGTVNISYTYEWENVLNPGIIISTTNEITGITAGDYLITVYDDNLCSQSTILTIGQPSQLTAVLDISEPLCNGDLNGQVLAVVSGGTVLTDYVYEWQDGIGNVLGNLSLISGLGIGNYLFVVRDDNNCELQIPFSIDEPALLSFLPTIQQITCAGIDDGEISVSISGGTEPYTIVWTDAFANVIGNDSIISNLAPGDYTLSVTDINGCSYSESYNISPLNTILATYNQYALGDCSINPPCIAAVEILPSGGSGVYTNFQWLDEFGNDLGINNDTATGLCSGSYLVTVTDSDNCSGTILVLVNDQNPEDITVSTEDPVCNGDLGMAIAQYICADAPCAIEWYDALTNTSLGLSTDTVFLAAGDYFVEITNATGCSTRLLFTILEPSALIPNASTTPVSCNGTCDGSASVAPTGGVLPYTYLWNDPLAQTAATALDLCAGDYDVIITDANLCSTTVTVTVASPSAITVIEDITNISCQGDANGIIELTASGGSGLYTYTWTPAPPIGNGTSIGSGLDEGDYTIEIEDLNNPGCILSVTYSISQPDSLTAILNTVESTCGSNDGEASVVISGGTPNYTYLWNDPANQTTDVATNLFSGIYTLTVTDNNLCSEDFFLAVNDQGADIVNIQILPGLCNADSSIVIASYNCLNPVCTLVWHDQNGTILPINGDTAFLPAGNYWVGLQNGLGCTWYTPFEVISISPIQPNLVFTNESCNGPADGTASVNPNGGNGNYVYTWTPEPGSGQNTNSVDGLYAGIWEVLIEDALGCDTLVSFEILTYTSIDAQLSHTDLSCNGDDGAFAIVNATGGNQPLTYVWTPEPGSGQGTNIANGLYAGDWSVTITDNTACDTTIMFSVLEPSALEADSVVVNASCNLIPGDGSIDLIISGGTAPYLYQWFDAAGNDLLVNTSFIDNLVEGIYHCDVIDDSLCTQTFVAIISEDGGEDIATGHADASCYGANDGMAWVEYICTDAPCIVNWYDALGVDLGLSTDTISGLIAGSYIVGVTNASGCVTYENIIVGEATEIIIDIAITEASCSGICDGAASASVSGGSGNYTYLWTPEPEFGQGTASVTGLCGGTWTLEITDDNGCSNSVDFEVTEIEMIFANIQIGDESCEGDCNGWAYVSPSGGSGDYTFFWSPEPAFGQGTDSASGLCGGDWSVLITDMNTGCNLTEMFVISQINPIFVTDTVFVNPECENDNSGSISIVVAGGESPYSYQWLDANMDPISGANDTIISDLSPGFYWISITDNIGCTHSELYELLSESLLIADAGNDTAYCEGNGPAVFIGSGNGVNSYWTDIFDNIITMGDTLIFDAPVGNYGYIYHISDGICTGSDTAYSVVFAAPDADAGPDEEIYPEESITIGGSPTGPSGSIYAWSPSESLNDSTLANPISAPLISTEYIVYVEWDNGCTGSDTTIITIKPKFDPNDGFTPNGDGTNDVWIIGDLTDFPNVEVAIFNRWGEQLFSSKGYSDPWDGKYNGKELPVGTYYYVIDLKDEKYPDAFTGPLTIMR